MSTHLVKVRILLALANHGDYHLRIIIHVSSVMECLNAIKWKREIAGRRL